ncbi:MAG TPA: hypothetical protein VK573_02240 [Gemmatimonadales bacterium]|nr:hypothetical protein [Gemmatimonadales bacterium]
MRSVALAGLVACFPLFADAQQLTSNEVSVGATASLARRTFAGAELGLAHRPSGDSRIALALAGGTAGQRAAARARLTLQLLVNSSARSGVGIYAGVGTAFMARRGSPGQGYLAVLLGLEGAPGRRHSWFVEAGLGGGVLAAGGWRLRWF